jgi:flagellin
MAMSIKSNVASLQSQRSSFQADLALSASLSKLSSGYRITKAGDDAAGLGVAVALSAQMRSYNQASRNAMDGQSLIQTAEGAANGTSNNLVRMRELAMQSSNGALSASDRANIDTEFRALVSEVDRTANATEFNGTPLLSSSTSKDFQVGVRDVAANDRISVNTVDLRATTLGVDTLSLSTQGGAQAALASIDTAIERVSTARASLGAAGNRLSNAISNIQTAAENTAASVSRIQDVDVASESANATGNSILAQMSAAVGAQASKLSRNALKLLA